MTSLITKKRIAKAFKVLLAQDPFEKISVVDIMQEAKIRRQTFYNHFLDKYELMDWIFETELKEQITDNLNYITGFRLLDELLYYLEQNQSFYQQLFQIKGQNDFHSYFLNYSFLLMEKILTEYQDHTQHVFSETDFNLLKTYHAHALIGWIQQQLNQKEPQLHEASPALKQLLLTSFSFHHL